MLSIAFGIVLTVSWVVVAWMIRILWEMLWLLMHNVENERVYSGGLVVGKLAG